MNTLSLANYHKLPSYGSTTLKTLLDKSPAHALYEKLNPKDPTPAMEFGTLFHQVMSDGLLSVVEQPRLDLRTKDGKTLKEAFDRELGTRSPVNADQYEALREMHASIFQNEFLRGLLSEGEHETNHFWSDQVQCKCRPDFISADKKVILDFKTTENASFKEFQKSVVKYSMHLQAAFYMDGVKISTGVEPNKFILVAIEKKAPYALSIFPLDEATIEAGRVLYKKALQTLAFCEETSTWPSYSPHPQMMNLPHWAWPEEEE